MTEGNTGYGKLQLNESTIHFFLIIFEDKLSTFSTKTTFINNIIFKQGNVVNSMSSLTVWS